MSGARKYVSMGLVLLVCTLTGHCGEGAPSAAPRSGGSSSSSSSSSRDAQSDWRRMVEMVRHAEDARGHHGSRTDAPATLRARGSTAEQGNQRTDKAEKSVVVFPRDLRKKEKFLKHMTGPLYFAPQCRKLVYRLYHHTRDCTIPAYYKRCARLLTRLAGSPQCTEG